MYKYIKSSATFNENNQRVNLKRIWNIDIEICICIGNKPSTANHLDEDKTTSTMIKILYNNDYGGFILVNIGQESIKELLGEIRKYEESDIVLCWGSKCHKQNKNKIGEFFSKLKEKKLEKYVKCFKKNKDKSPSQPTYLAYKTNIKNYFDI